MQLDYEYIIITLVVIMAGWFALSLGWQLLKLVWLWLESKLRR